MRLILNRWSNWSNGCWVSNFSSPLVLFYLGFLCFLQFLYVFQVSLMFCFMPFHCSLFLLGLTPLANSCFVISPQVPTLVFDWIQWSFVVPLSVLCPSVLQNSACTLSQNLRVQHSNSNIYEILFNTLTQSGTNICIINIKAKITSETLRSRTGLVLNTCGLLSARRLRYAYMDNWIGLLIPSFP